jgi:anti-sigma regulatory factor (Ser/Thr protein kinase)
MRELACLSVENRIEEVGRAQDQLAALWLTHGLPEAAHYAVSVGLEEALSNIIRHGGIAGKPHRISIHFLLDGDVFQLELADDGQPFDPLTAAPAPNLAETLQQRQPGGLGVFLLRSLFDDLHYQYADGWNHLRLRKQMPPGPGCGG